MVPPRGEGAAGADRSDLGFSIDFGFQHGRHDSRIVRQWARALAVAGTFWAQLGVAAAQRKSPHQALAAQHRKLRVRRHWSLLWHWTTTWLRAPKRLPAAPLPQVVRDGVAVTFGGHATLLVRYPSCAIAVDPMLGNWVGAVRRATAPGLAPADFDDIDVVLLTHLHVDHCHLPTLAQLPKSAMVIGPRGTANLLAALGFARVLELAPGTHASYRHVTVFAEPVRHGSEACLAYVIYERNRTSAALPGEAVAGVAPETVAGEPFTAPSVFVCGDSGWFSGFADIGERYAPDIACLPIGGFYPLSFRTRHMSPIDALRAFADLRARLLIPIHHSAFTLSYEKLAEPLRILREAATTQKVEEHLAILTPGQTEQYRGTLDDLPVPRALADDAVAQALFAKDTDQTTFAFAQAEGQPQARVLDQDAIPAVTPHEHGLESDSTVVELGPEMVRPSSSDLGGGRYANATELP